VTEEHATLKTKTALGAEIAADTPNPPTVI
jgi:hypothetical protein